MNGIGQSKMANCEKNKRVDGRLPWAASISRPFWVAAILTAIGSVNPELNGQPEERDQGNAIIHKFLGEHANRIHSDGTKQFSSKAELLASKTALKSEYLYMLGLDPMPERTPLRATKTGELKGEGYEVEMIHFQSSPGLYVTGNLYRPTSLKSGDKLPAILYVCGHADRGRNGNKAAYQSNGIWFARHGYVCLMIDTLQRGEIAGIHHGTYRENRWWWHSRGYTPAGLECWNGIRAIDYLFSRPDVDAGRIGLTGISGGGAVSFWIAAADERIRAVVPISGLADLPSYVGDRVVNGHCDCMFLHNTYEWPCDRVAALIVPRPLLFVNSDQDPLFPMDANERVSNRFESLYSLFGAGDQVDSVVSIGGHAYREDIRKATYRFMNIHLKNDPTPVTDSEVDIVTGRRGEEVHPIAPERLRVFPTDGDLPKDHRNGTIDQFFVPMASVALPKQGPFDSWRDGLVTKLREVTFRSFPERIPAATFKQMGASDERILESEIGIETSVRTVQRNESVKRILLIVNTGINREMELGDFAEASDAVYECDPRGVGRTIWSIRNPPNYVARSHVLLGRTVEDGRIWDIVAVARYLHQQHEGKASVYLVGEGAGAVLSAYAMLLEPSIDGAILNSPIMSHMDPGAPSLLNVLRVCDFPDVLGGLAPRTLSLKGVDQNHAKKVAQIYDAANARDRLATR